MTDKQMLCKMDSVFLADVLNEIERARRKHPHFDITLAAVGEEFGEVCKAMTDENANAVWNECVQLAAMALKLAVDGDRSMEPWRDKLHLGGVGRLGPLEKPPAFDSSGSKAAVTMSAGDLRLLVHDAFEEGRQPGYGWLASGARRKVEKAVT